MPESNDNMIAGDGDGIKLKTQRIMVNSSRKFTATLKKNVNMKEKLKLALDEMNRSIGKTNNKKVDSVSLDTPSRLTKRKLINNNKEKETTISLYATPRELRCEKLIPNDMVRKFFNNLLLNSWRKTRLSCKDMNETILDKNEKINQLIIQIDVLQNLRKSQSIRVEDLLNKYQKIIKKFEELGNKNLNLENSIENLKNESINDKTKLKLTEEELRTQIKLNEENQKTLMVLKKVFEKERENSLNEKKHLMEINNKLENKLKVQEENFENIKKYLENLQNSKRSLESVLEKSEENREHFSKKFDEQLILTENYKEKLDNYEIENFQLSEEIKLLNGNLEILQNDYYKLKDKNDIYHEEMMILKEKFKNNKKSTWIIVKKGMSSTYFAIHYLAHIMLSALQQSY